MTAASPRLGDPVPPFSLPEVTSDETVTFDDVVGPHGAVVMFLCRHCPYVKHVQDEVARLARDYAASGVGFVGISANDITAQPDDAPPRLAEQKRTVGFDFPYLFDESQTVAQAFGAACTPEFFVADR
ncbi:MAG: redoxin domain-containing protein, partial [Nitriliruptoraceae bacterium]